MSETVKVAVVGDTAPEETEQFVLRLTRAAGAALADAEGAATILDDDPAAKPDPTLT